MEFKTHRYITTVLWGLMFVMSSAMYMIYKEPISLFISGYSLGMGLMTLIFNPLVNIQDKLIKVQHKLIDTYKKK